MSVKLLEFTKLQIDIGYEEKNTMLIEQQTEFIFNKIMKALIFSFSDKIVGIQMDIHSFNLPTTFLFTDKHKKNLMKWLYRLAEIDKSTSDLEFGKIKIDYENWYYELGGEMMEYVYVEDYLLTPTEAAHILGISKVTLNKYIKQGMECLDNGKHRKIPKFAVEIFLNDPVYTIKMQILAQDKKKGKQTPQERAIEIAAEIMELRTKYEWKTFEEAFAGYDGDEMDDPTDYYRWQGLELELSDIMKLSGGERFNE
ncbi:excisionase family DNA binding protein [Paenibacillus phyllosphaerae]|uniref:Excisionase family DNA binding protein n=1 Tax=Paenibacillus phyllosphaerae TaxID=274593 RepID=A0A7W5FLF6_9BACL|nr:helix-turn-helix domain-containing protein [Paenibacillus phyllosphaerae]MBB3109121.1 excisionase family DNA binding protein [Paenibacillus phyllosphaerae]